MGKAYVHTVIDDHSHVAYAEIHDDEAALTAAAVLVRAVEWFNHRGIGDVSADDRCLGYMPRLSAVCWCWGRSKA